MIEHIPASMTDFRRAARRRANSLRSQVPASLVTPQSVDLPEIQDDDVDLDTGEVSLECKIRMALNYGLSVATIASVHDCAETTVRRVSAAMKHHDGGER